MDIAVPLTLETVRLVVEMCPKKFNSTPEYMYDVFYKQLTYTYIYIYSSGSYFFANEADLKDRQYVPVTVEEVREILFIRSLET